MDWLSLLSLAAVALAALALMQWRVRRIKREWPGGATPLVVATGGLAETLRPFCNEFDRVEPFLTLIGLRLAYELLSARAPAGDGARGGERSAAS